MMMHLLSEIPDSFPEMAAWEHLASVPSLSSHSSGLATRRHRESKGFVVLVLVLVAVGVREVWSQPDTTPAPLLGVLQDGVLASIFV